MSTFRRKVLTGLSWSAAGQGGEQVLHFVLMVILARLLSPREFGLLAMIRVFSGFGDRLSDMGFGPALVQKRDLGEAHLSSVFWVQVLAGLLLAGLFAVGAPWIASFYDEPILAPLSMLMAVNFLIRPLAIVQRALLRKNMNFRAISLVQIAAMALSGVVAIVLARKGFGVWSLAVQTVLLSAVSVVLLWVFSSWRPTFRFTGGAVRELLRFSLHVTATQVLHYWTRNLDKLLIGKVLGKVSLGVYGRAYGFLLMPVQQMKNVVMNVLFPGFSQIQDDHARIKRVFLRGTGVVALFVFPALLGLAVTADCFVLGVLGERWAMMSPVLVIFCFIGFIQSLLIFQPLYLSQGRADLRFRVGLFTQALTFLGVIVGLKWGILGIAWGLLAAASVNMWPQSFFAGRLVGLRSGEFVCRHAGIAFCAGGMALVLVGARCVLPTGWNPLFSLMVLAVAGAILYAALILVAQPQGFRDLRAMVTEHFAR